MDLLVARSKEAKKIVFKEFFLVFLGEVPVGEQVATLQMPFV